MKNFSFFEEFGVLIVAVIALIQPWLIYVWRRYINQGKVEFFETGNIEIGFSGFASTIGINGTLRAIDKDFFISSINLELTKEKDSSKHYFDWAIFRNTKLHISDNDQTTVELPYGIMLTTQSPQRINIQFHDRKQQEIIRPILDKLTYNWQNFLEEKFPYANRRTSTDIDNEIYSVFQTFNATSESIEAYGSFNREFYWDKGNYNLLFKIQTSKPNRVFTKSFNFSLNEEDCTLLRYNVLTLKEFACGQNRFKWNFAFTNFQK